MLEFQPMRLPRPRFTVQRMMVVVAIVAFELSLGSFLYHEVQARKGTNDAFLAWVETGFELAFLNLLIGGPFWLFLRALEQQNATTDRSGRKDR